MVPEIPEIPSELQPSIRSLAHAAFIFRGVFVQAAEGRSIDAILAEREEALILSEKVIDAWCKHLRLETDAAVADGD
jgi:hypothetical protein